MNNTILDVDGLVSYLKDKYQAKLIILYGSYARLDYNANSDVDLLCVCETIKVTNDSMIINDKQLDCWFYELEELNQTIDYLQVLDGVIIYDEIGIGEKFLHDVRQLYLKGPEPITNDERIFYHSWLNKMYLRTLTNDIDSSFRKHWLLYESLEIYCHLTNQWYLGPKMSLHRMKEHDLESYSILEDVLNKPNETNLQQWVVFLNSK